MLALRSAPPLFAIAEGERIARDIYGLGVSVRPLSGERDCNFHVHTADGRDYVLKIMDAASHAQADCQVQVLRHLAEQDPSLPVPRMYATQQGADLGSIRREDGRYSTCLMGYLPGQLLAERTPDAALLRVVGATLAGVDRALRGFFHPALAQHLAWDVRRLPQLVEFAAHIESAAVRRCVEGVVDSLKRCLPALSGLRGQAIHGDCHGHNVLIDAADRVGGILDFGDMIHAPLILEPAVAMSECLTEGIAEPAALSMLLEGYARAQPLESAEVAVLFDLLTARHAVTILLHAWRSQYDRDGAHLLERAAAHAGRSLDQLLDTGREALTREWHEVAGTTPPSTVPVDRGRRRRLLGGGAELFYDRPLHLVSGQGVWLYDPDGQAYLDVYNNVPHVGHAHPTVVRAMQRQSALLATHTRYLHEGILDYAEQLTARLPSNLDTCIFVNSGSEANDVAWRMAQFATGQRGALIMAHAYHGITDAVAALTPGAGQPQDPWVATLAVPGASAATGVAAANDTDQAIRTLAGRGLAPAAFFIDTALTSSGIYDPAPEWAAAVAARVRAAGGVVVADEVQYGLGRSGSHFWGFERRGLKPDIVTLGKPVANGYPMGVVIANRALIEDFQARYGFFSTFGGNAVAAAAARAVLDVLDREQLVANARDTGDYLREQLASLAARHSCFGAVRGSGLLLGLEVLGDDIPQSKTRTKALVNSLAWQARVLIGSEGPLGNILKLRPPMPFRPEHADLLVRALDAAAQSDAVARPDPAR
jgi:4-aminobutyrate aminotransferase-like enzyme/Ser/Thr protein kinase RdoA (MazF antagonist)